MQIFPYISLTTHPDPIAESFLVTAALHGAKGAALNTEDGNRWEKQRWQVQNVEESSYKIKSTPASPKSLWQLEKLQVKTSAFQEADGA